MTIPPPPIECEQHHAGLAVTEIRGAASQRMSWRFDSRRPPPV